MYGFNTRAADRNPDTERVQRASDAEGYSVARSDQSGENIRVDMNRTHETFLQNNFLMLCDILTHFITSS